MFLNALSRALVSAACLSLATLGLPAMADTPDIPAPLVEDMAMAVVSAEQALSQGDAKTAYGLAREAVRAGFELEKANVIAGLAALDLVKQAGLFGKQKRAIRARNHLRAALEINPENQQALFSLATFALRAPEKMGGGQVAFTAYAERLAKLNPQLYARLRARVEMEAKNTAAAFAMLEQALALIPNQQTLAEVANYAVNTKAVEEGYALIAAHGDVAQPCTGYFLAGLADKIDESGQVALDHYVGFLDTGAAYCNRKPVLPRVYARAIELSEALGQDERAAQLREASEIYMAERPSQVSTTTATSGDS